MKQALILAATLAMAGCASSPTVSTDYDPGAEFSRYRTYMWRQQPPISDPLVKQHVVSTIDGSLRGKGWVLVEGGGADIALVANVASRNERTIETFQCDPGWYAGHGQSTVGTASAYRTTQVRIYKVGTLVVDMFDTRTGRAIWRATAEGTVPEQPAKVHEAVQTAVDRMFAEFPPGSEGQK